MKRIFFACFTVFLLTFCGCVKEGDYKSCKISSTSSIFSHDRAHDLRQCWNIPGEHSKKSDALRWCEAKVLEYYNDRYNFGALNAGSFTVTGSECP